MNIFFEKTGLSLLEGRYRIEHEIKHGKSSTSFFGIDEKTGADVFVKLSIFPRSDLEKARFKNEVKFLKDQAFFNALHKKTPEYISDGELFDGKILYLITDKIHGTLLSDWIDNNWQSATLRDRLIIAYRVFGAAEHFGMFATHRDLHVGNIILLDEEIDLYSDHPNFKTIVLDWGQSYCRPYYEYSESDSDDMVLIHNGIGKEITNSFYNLPPETFTDWENSGSQYNKYDSWAMGLLLYKLITGNNLFSFKNIGEYASSLNRIDLAIGLARVEISKVASDKTPILSCLLSRLMCKNPSDRMFIQNARLALWFILVEEFAPTDPQVISEFLDSPTHYEGVKWNHFRSEPFDYS